MKSKSRKLISTALVAATFLSSTGVVFAGGDTMPPREGEQGYHGDNQPSSHGYNKQNILDWTPETDADSEFMRAKVPLQKRNDPFTATQANSKLDQNVKSLALAEDYGNSFFDSYHYNDQFSQHILNFWQYLDYHASWHGMVTDPAPKSLFDPEAEWWQREYEFGILNLPNPAYTNAAHKNGVEVLGCIFFPRAEHSVDVIYKDENGRFPVADKLVEMANYYGFDGYFINAEERQTKEFMPLYAEFVQAMTEQGLYIQTYASNLFGRNNRDRWGSIDYYNKTAENFSYWLQDDDGKMVSDSLYMNPDPSRAHVDSSVKAMEELGIDPKYAVFNTLEAGQTGFSGKRGSLYNTYDEDLVPRTAIASLGNATSWAHLDETLFGHSGPNSYDENRRGNPDYQKYAIARQRTWYSGATDAPHYTNANGDPTILKQVLDATPDPVATANNPNRVKQTAWPGLAAFISERSIINGNNFYTNFNTGHGLAYYIDGEVSNENEWANMNIQDILPTWQWWIDKDEEVQRLKVDFDYGPKYDSAFDYEKVGGYKGGSSLVVKGDLDGDNFLRLYKTDLDVAKHSEASITFNKPTDSEDVDMKLGLIFKDTPEEVEYIEIDDSDEKTNGWETETIKLKEYQGREVAAIGIGFFPEEGTTVEDYQMNIGEIKLTDSKTKAPKAPTGLKIDKAFDTTEMYISWDLADYGDVQQYNVYAEYENGEEVYLGGIYDNVFYIKSLYDPQGTVEIKVTAVGKNGEESKPAVVERDFDSVITGITVQESDGLLDVSWENPDVKFDHVEAAITFSGSNMENMRTTSAQIGITDMVDLEESTLADVIDMIDLEESAPIDRVDTEEPERTTPAQIEVKKAPEKDKQTTAQIAVPVVDGSQNRKYTLRLSLVDKKGRVISYTDYSGELTDLICQPYEGKVLKSGRIAKVTMPKVYDWWKLYAYQNGKQLLIGGKSHAVRGVSDLTNVSLVDSSSNTIEIVLEDYEGNKSEPVTIIME